MVFKDIFDRVKQVHPNAGEKYVMALVNDALMELRKYKVSRKFATIDVVAGQRWYSIGNKNSDLNVDKIYSVSYKNEDGNYRKIPRLLDPDSLIFQEVK